MTSVYKFSHAPFLLYFKSYVKSIK